MLGPVGTEERTGLWATAEVTTARSRRPRQVSLLHTGPEAQLMEGCSVQWRQAAVSKPGQGDRSPPSPVGHQKWIKLGSV